MGYLNEWQAMSTHSFAPFGAIRNDNFTFAANEWIDDAQNGIFCTQMKPNAANVL